MITNSKYPIFSSFSESAICFWSQKTFPVQNYNMTRILKTILHHVTNVVHMFILILYCNILYAVHIFGQNAEIFIMILASQLCVNSPARQSIIIHILNYLNL